MENLKSISLFADLPEKTIKSLREVLKRETYADGQVIFSEGDPGDALFAIQKGKVYINKAIDAKEGTFKILAVLKENDFFGEMALIDEGPRSASAIASGQTIVLRFSRQDFRRFLQSDIQTALRVVFALLKTASTRLRQTNKELVTVYETGKIIGSVRCLEEMSQKILERVMSAIETADKGLVAIWNEFIEEFEIQAAVGYTFRETEETSFRKDDPIVHWLLEHREHLIINDLANDERFLGISEEFYYGPSILASPFIHFGRLLGFILLTSRVKESAFSPCQINMLGGITAQVAAAIENACHTQEEAARLRLEQAGYKRKTF